MQIMNPQWSTERRRGLRQSATPEEQIIWRVLRNRSLDAIKFRRQCGLGGYIVDFFAAEVRIIVELDGNQHYTPEGLVYDAERTAYLEAQGLRVMRFCNARVREDLSGVLKAIKRMNQLQISAGVLPFRE